MRAWQRSGCATSGAVAGCELQREAHCRVKRTLQGGPGQLEQVPALRDAGGNCKGAGRGGGAGWAAHTAGQKAGGPPRA